ncbi:hypothetical protein Sango_2686500 [Sesamum angolense]|uniref:RNase H type-1 domain-containing protein n=1 Tax=Sesamum angolense TaxID=2727404 RepID=A0AAE2BHL4_9LAMI|nr:hypothetical protein Sango_2686500 [Sesamum angolense]
MGDFNAILSQQEKRGGRPFASASRNNLGDEIDACNLIDLGFVGPRFTWNNKRPGCANIQSRLDSGVANVDWCLLYPKSIIFHLLAIASDHCPLLLDTHPNSANRPRPFFFEEMWCRDFSCESVIADTWLFSAAGNKLKIEEVQQMDQSMEVLEIEQNLQWQTRETHMLFGVLGQVRELVHGENDKQTRIVESEKPLQTRKNGPHQSSSPILASVPNVNFLGAKKDLNKLDAIMRRFWWQTDWTEGNSRVLALKSWNTICQPKSAGGLGFRKFADFNKALVAKIAWNIAKKSDKLWCSILIAKYLKNESNLLTYVQDHRASWIWQDVLKSLKIIKNGACYSISAHSSLQIWNDPWIPSIQGFSPQKPASLNPNWPTQVADLIDQQDHQWKLDLLAQMFTPDTIQEIRKIQILESLEPPRLFWMPSKSGKFSTKTAYLTIIQNAEIMDSEGALIGKRICNLELHNRLKLLIWRVLFDVLPTREQIWLLSKWQVRLHRWSHLSLREWFTQISKKGSTMFLDQESQQEFTTAWAVTLEAIWKARNELTHGRKTSSPVEIADVAYKDDRCVAAITAREQDGIVVVLEAHQIYSYDATLAELQAIRIAVVKMNEMNAECTIFESDSATQLKSKRKKKLIGPFMMWQKSKSGK